MTEQSKSKMALSTLNRNLGFLERMLGSFADIFSLDVLERAGDVGKQVEAVIDLYFNETYDSSEVITSGLDLEFSKLEFDSAEFSKRVDQLGQSLSSLSSIYEEFVLCQAIVMLVSSLELYLSTMFSVGLHERYPLGERAIVEIVSRYNFQNWGNAVEAYRNFLGIELCSRNEDGVCVTLLQQKRHLLVHQLGIIDQRGARSLGLSVAAIGQPLRVKEADVRDAIALVHRIALCLQESIGDSVACRSTAV